MSNRTVTDKLEKQVETREDCRESLRRWKQAKIMLAPYKRTIRDLRRSTSGQWQPSDVLVRRLVT